jgi:hypothetical protein
LGVTFSEHADSAEPRKVPLFTRRTYRKGAAGHETNKDHALKSLKVTLPGGCEATYPSMHLRLRSEEVAKQPILQCIEEPCSEEVAKQPILQFIEDYALRML